MVEFARPDADGITLGTWTTTPLWSKVDEGDPGDSVLITSDDNTSPDRATLRLGDVTDPASSASHILRAKWQKDSTGGHAIDARLELFEGDPDGTPAGSLRATLLVVDIGGTGLQVDTYTLSGAEADSITDYTNLFLRVSREGDTGGSPGGRRSLQVEYVELEVPSGGTTTQESIPTTPVGTATVAPATTFATSLAPTGTAAATFVKAISKTLAASALNTNTFVRKTLKTLTNTATGSPSIATAMLSTQTISAGVIGAAAQTAAAVIAQTIGALSAVASSISNVFTPGEGGSALNHVRVLLRAITKSIPEEILKPKPKHWHD